MKDPNVILKNAVDSAIGKINQDKLSPQEAVTKMAQEQELNVDFIKRACEVVNVALSYNHFSKNAATKDEDFPIVDYNKVVSDIFGKQEKTAAELRAEWFPPVDSFEEINFERILNDASYKEAYMNIVKQAEADANDEFKMSMIGVFEKAAAYLESLERELSDLQTKEASLNWDYNGQFTTLIEKFARDANYRASFGEFESQAYSMFGEKAVPYVDLIYKAAGLSEERGVHDSKYQLFDNCKEAEDFASFIKSLDGFLETSKQAADLTELLKSEKAYLQEAHAKLASSSIAPNTIEQTLAPVHPVDHVSHEMPIMGDPVEAAAKRKIKAEESEELDESVLTEGQKKLPHKLKKAIIGSKKKVAALTDPRYKEAFGWTDAYKALQDKAKSESSPGSSIPGNSPGDNQDRVLMLQELMSTDPILSSVEPKKIGAAYEQFMRIAPELSREKEIVRSHLRTSVQGQALSPYDAQQYIEANTSFIKQRKLQEGGEKEHKG